jgi:hypothetical protein
MQPMIDRGPQRFRRIAFISQSTTKTTTILHC